MSRLPSPGSDDGTWGDILNDYLSVAHAAGGTLNANIVTTAAIATGAVTAAKLSATSPAANNVLTYDGTALTWTALTKASVGLSNVDNTSDANKPVSTAQQTALDAKVAKAGDTMTGTLTAPSIVGSGNSATNYIAVTAKNTNTTGGAVLDIDRPSTPRLAATEYSTAGTPNWYTGLLKNGGAPTTGYGVSTDPNQSNAKFLLDTTGNATFTGNVTANGQLLASASYVQSRLQNLVTNGSGLLGNNYNFSGFTYDTSDVYSGAGSFKNSTASASTAIDELIPIDPTLTYTGSLYAKSTTYVAGAHAYFGATTFDIDGLAMGPTNVAKYAGSTDTTLAVTLNPGDTTVTLTSAAGWYNSVSVATYSHFIWYGYTNAKGYTYPDYTYSRLTSYSYSSNNTLGTWLAGGITGNVITLRVPWAGPTIAAGTAIRNNQSGSSYRYFMASNVNIPNTWTNYTGVMSGLDVNGTLANNLFPYGAAYMKLNFLLNRDVAGNTTNLSAVTFGVTQDTSNFVTLDGAQTISGVKNFTGAPVLSAGATIQNGQNIILGTTSGSAIGTDPTQKLGFYGATPVVQQGATTDISTVLSNLGLRAVGAAWPITTSGAVTLSGSVATTGNVRSGTAILTSATTLTITSVEYQLADATTAAFNVTMPATTTTGYRFTIKKTDASVNAVTVIGTIDGAANYVLSAQYQYITLISTGTSGVWQVAAGGSSAGAYVDLTTAQTIGGVKTFSAAPVFTAGATINASSIVTDTTTGLKLGTATTQKLGFFNATPVVQQAATTDLGTVLSGLGLRAAGTAYPITTSGATSFSGTNTLGGGTTATGAFAMTGNIRTGVAVITAATTLTLASVEYQYANATTAAFNVTLPSTATAGYRFTIKKTDASANAVTVVGTVDGATNYVLSAQNQVVTVASTATAGTWYIVSDKTTSTSTGTVTSTSVVSANGLAGTVATATTTPAITLTTTVTGIVKGNGTALSAATSGTDYAPGTSANTTGIVKSTTGTGALTTAIAADFPTLNQNTTGTAANVTGTVAIANGGTGATTAAAALTNLGGAPLLTNTTSQTANYTATVNKLNLTNATSGNLTVTLPASAAGQYIVIKKTDASVNTVTLSGTINGVSGTLVLRLQNQTKELINDGSTGWNTTAGDLDLATLDNRYSTAGSSALVLVLGPTDTVPGGTAAGTVIIRKTS